MKTAKTSAFVQASLLVVILLGLPLTAAASNFEIPTGTAIPIVFSRTIDSRKARPGDMVTAKTMQVVTLPSGEVIPKNSTLTGQVVGAQGSAHGESSELSIRFDDVVVNKEKIPIRTSLRALASPNESDEASYPRGPVGADFPQTTTLIGGAYTYLLDKHVYGPSGKIIGENRSNGAFARLDSGCHNTGSCCSGSATVQSLGIFSPSACGLYGFGDDEIATAGDKDGLGIFTLESSDSSVKIYGRSTALLQVISPI